MTKDEMRELFQEELQKGFDQWFSADVLQGRPKLITDIAPRTYPYTDLLSAYSAGVNVAVDLIIMAQEMEEGDDQT